MFTSCSIKIPGSTGRWPVVFGGSPNTCFPASHRKVHASRVRSPIRLAALLTFVSLVCFGQEPSPTASPNEAEVESVVVSATRFDIPLINRPQVSPSFHRKTSSGSKSSA